MKKRKAWIFDVDGTLANVDSILHHVLKKDRKAKEFKKYFDKFHIESIHVPANKDVIDLLWEVCNDYDIIVVTARREEWRARTAYWLVKNNVPHTALFMRGNEDDRSDYEIKKDILKHISKFWKVVHAVDDNPKIIKLWKKHGISTTKIGDWDGEYV